MSTEKKTSIVRLLLGFAYLLCFQPLIAQLKADFIADKTEGCVLPSLVVQFTNKTTGASPLATYSWNLGLGNTPSTLLNPQAFYKNEGVYTVTLTVTDGAHASTFSKTITVHKNPEAAFIVNATKGCIPFTTTFTSTSLPGEGVIDLYVWGFGNGNTQSGNGLKTVSNMYGQVNTFGVSLTVTNTFGCQSTPVTKSNIIQTFPAVKTSFLASKALLCKTGDAVNFINSSIGAGTLTYNWDFGDGTTSSDQAPLHRYMSKGAFTVGLSVSSSEGCADTLVYQDYIKVINSTIVHTPPVVCKGTRISFESTSLPLATLCQWYFTDSGAVNFKRHPLDSNVAEKTFLKTGNHKVRLINFIGGCKDTVEKNIQVFDTLRMKKFVVVNNAICGAPGIVDFSDSTSGAVSWAWHFGTGVDSSSLKAPSFNYLFDSAFDVTLKVTNADGCTGSVTQKLNIYKPLVTITSLRSSSPYMLTGCDTLAVSFNALSGKRISTYLWDFAGVAPTSSDTFPRHFYGTPGRYTVNLTYTTVEGCSGKTDYTNNVNVYKTPMADFTANVTETCGSNPVFFMENTSKPVDKWLWIFNDSITLLGQDGFPLLGPAVVFNFRDSGYHNVKMIAFNDVCSDTVVKLNYIHASPPFPRIAAVLHSCDSTRGNVTFIDSSKYTSTLVYDFGDGSPLLPNTSVNPNVHHTYTKSGKYKTYLTATNGPCTVTDSLDVFVLLKQHPVLSATHVEVCASDSIQVLINNLDSNFFGAPFYYQAKWLYGDGTAFMGTARDVDSFTNKFIGILTGLENGKQDIKAVIVSSNFNCYDTTNFIPVKIKGPRTGLVVNKNGCFKKPVVFTDSSQGRNNVPIKTWLWDFGDGALRLNFKGNEQHGYSSPGNYPVSLTVTDTQGCKALVYDTIALFGPKADFYWTPPQVEPGTTVTFINNSNEYDSVLNNHYHWRFSHGQRIINNQPLDSNLLQFYPALTVDTVRLIADNGARTCIDTVVKLVKVQEIYLAFTFTKKYIDPSINCPPLIAKFTSTSINVSSVKWFFGDGGTAGNTHNPTHTYSKPGMYKILLIGYGLNGILTDTIVDYVKVSGPYAKLSTDIQQGCSPLTVTIRATESNISSFAWDFRDGTLLPTTDTFATHTYHAGLYTPAIIIKDVGGCEASFELPNAIMADSLHVAFAGAPYIGCAPSDILFGSTKTSIAAGIIANALSYHWDFGTGNTADTANTALPSFNYTLAGTYNAKLKVRSVAGCEANITTPVAVKPLVKPLITGPSDVCEGVFAQYNANTTIPGTIGWNWYFDNGNTYNGQVPGSQKFNGTAPFAVIALVTTLNGCADTTRYTVAIHNNPIINPVPKAPLVCEGSPLQLTAHGGNKYKWSPALNIDNDSIATPFISPKITTAYKVKATTVFGCVATDTVFATVANKFTLRLVADTFVCINSSVQLKASGASAGGSYKWIGNTVGLSDVNIPDPMAAPVATSSIYTVTATDAANCFTETAIAKVVVKPLPVISAGADLVVPAGTSLYLKTLAGADVVKYAWAPATYLDCSSCAIPKATPRDSITYKVTATSKYGCTATDAVSITLTCGGNTLAMPNAFTPNRDRLNDVFYPLGKGIRTVKHFAVYGRWGDVVFEKSNFNINDKSAGWDGRYKGMDQPSGAYVYIIDVECDTGEPFSLKGTVTLIR